MPTHERDDDEQSVFDNNNPSLCNVPWCEKDATDSDYCYEHYSRYTQITVTYE